MNTQLIAARTAALQDAALFALANPIAARQTKELAEDVTRMVAATTPHSLAVAVCDTYYLLCELAAARHGYESQEYKQFYASLGTARQLPTEAPLYIQYLGGWCIFPKGAEGSAILAKLPTLTARKSAQIARNGVEFAAYLRDNKLGKLVADLTGLMPELRAIAVNY